MLITSIILINLALIVYTIPIISGLKRKKLLFWHVVMFCICFICDVSGTFLMFKLGGNKISTWLHDILGYIALVIMLINVIGSVLILRKYHSLNNQFYKFSIFAWIIWVISYALGILVHL
jgi:uncharacterized repeat protein (TIGR03987 family)